MRKLINNYLLACMLMMLSPVCLAIDTLDVSLEKGQLLLTPKHGGDGSAWGKSNCETCHLSNYIHSTARSIRGIVRRKGQASCAGCHGQNGTNIKRKCTICHNSKDLPSSPHLTGIENHNFSTEEISPLENKQCLVCHLASDMDGSFELDIDLTQFPDQNNKTPAYNNSSEFCLRCHNRDHQQPDFEMIGEDFRDPLIAMEDNYQFIDMHGILKGTGERTYVGLRDPNYQYGSIVDCVDCHTMHGTNNDLLIIDSSDQGAFKLSPELRQKPYPVTVVDGDYSQLCVLCHNMDLKIEEGDVDTGNGLSGVHETGSDNDCRECHTHGQAVQTGL